MTGRPQRRHRPAPERGYHSLYRAPRQPRLAPGELRALVDAHLHAHSHMDFTPAELANVLGRSRGAVINACRRLVKAGRATRTQQTPQRYQATRRDTPQCGQPGPATSPD